MISSTPTDVRCRFLAPASVTRDLPQPSALHRAPSRFDDRRRRLIRGGAPCHGIDRRPAALRRDRLEGRFGGGVSRSDTAVARRAGYAARHASSATSAWSRQGWEESGRGDSPRGSSQVQRVIPCLVVVAQAELAFAALELNRKDGWSDNQHRIDSAAKARDLELEVEVGWSPQVR